MKVRIIGLPREDDPELQRQLWLGMELTIVEDTDASSSSSGEYYWVHQGDVIRQIEEKGDKDYADFFRRLWESPGGRFAPGFLVEKQCCEIVE